MFSVLGGGFATAGGPGFKQNPGSDFAGPAETLSVGEPVAAPESADGLALASNIRQGRVGADAVTEFLEFAINGSLPQFWPECHWIEEDVDVF